VEVPATGPASDPAALEQALEEALRERNRLWHEAQRANALEHDLHQMRLVLQDMQSSFSWRITEPLRRMKNRVGPRARRAAELGRKARALLQG
jgi:hypothetical protein